MSENGFTSNYLHMADVLQSFTCFTSNDFVFNHSSHHSSHVNTRAGHALLTANIFVRTRSRKESVSHIALIAHLPEPSRQLTVNRRDSWRCLVWSAHLDRLTGFVLCKWIVEDATRGTEELSSDELDDDFAFFVGFATAEAFVAAQQLGPLVFVSFRLWLVSCLRLCSHVSFHQRCQNLTFTEPLMSQYATMWTCKYD